MTNFTEGQEVVVTDRRHHLSYEEGVVVRAEPDTFDRVRVRVEGRAGMGWDAIERSALAPLPRIGERRRWTMKAGPTAYALGPFMVAYRSDDEERLFEIVYDASWRNVGASAAELANFSELVTEPDGADDGTTGETVAVVEIPARGYGKRAAMLDGLRAAVVERALSWAATSPSDPGHQARATDLRDATRELRKAMDS